MAKVLIRMAACGFELNFGEIVVAESSGIQFAVEKRWAEYLGFKIVSEEEIPQFYDDLKLVLQMNSSQPYIYPFRKEDIRELGRLMSHVGSVARVDADHKARILMMWQDGKVLHEHKTIDHFYDGMTEAEIEHSRF